LSSEVLPEFREFERFSTTVANAYLSSRLDQYLASLERELRAAGLPEPVVMQSSGGVQPSSEARRRAAASVLSGPAAGVVGAAYAARCSGYSDVLTLDMGGTSTDVAPVLAGIAGRTPETSVAGVPIRLPAVDVHSVSAGGGSIAWLDEGGALRVGPRSAGARPGPAAYALGGEEPTVTDANLVLGYLADGTRLGGDLVLDESRARRAVAGLADEAGMEVEAAAEGIVDVANAEMVRALRVITVERGLDPGEFALVAFGGAGPMHACALADDLGIETVLVPRAGGVLSALGLAVADLRIDLLEAFPERLEKTDPGRLEGVFRDMEEKARGALEGARCLREADLRYRGQAFELTVDASDATRLASRFHQAHERRYGYDAPSEEIEITCLRVTAVIERADPGLRAPRLDASPEQEVRRALFSGESVECVAFSGADLGEGFELRGPAVVSFEDSTCVVPPSWGGRIDRAGALVLERTA
jgi:N-methylhydantoinase A